MAVEPIGFVGTSSSDLSKGDDSFSLVTVCRDGKHGSSFFIGYFVCHISVDAKVFIVRFDFTNWFPYRSRFWHVQLIVI